MFYTRFARLFLSGACLAMLGMPCVSYASSEVHNPSEIKQMLEDLHAQKQKLEEKEKELSAQQEAVVQERQRLQFLLSKTETLLGDYRGMGYGGAGEEKPLEDGESVSSVEPSSGDDRSQARGENEEVGVERKTEDQAKPDVPAVVVDEGGVLLPKGKVVLEPSLQYSRSSALRVNIDGYTIIPAINIGAFELSEVDRDIVTTALTARVGVTNRLEMEAYVPFVWREDSTTARPIGVGTSSNVTSTTDGYGIGDVELAAHYQINDGKNNWPFFIGNMRFKSVTGEGPFDVPTDSATGIQTEIPTGSGFYSLNPSVTALFPSDPVVFFGNLGYVYNMEHDYGGSTGKINPGDSISFGLGMGFSINDRASYSLGYSHSTVFETEQNGQTLSNSDILQVGSMAFGYSYRLTDNISASFNVNAGLTDDAPDVQTTFRVPISFDLF